jgi:hypothetical protein
MIDNMFQIYTDFNLLQVIFKTQIDLVQLFFFSDNLSCNAKFLNSISSKHLLISIYPTSGWKNVYGKCCWKVLRSITILSSHTCTDLISTLNKIGGSDTSSIGLLTCSTKFKLVNVINLTS